MIQQLAINKYLSRISIEELIEKNQKKAAKKREKKGTNAQKLSEMLRFTQEALKSQNRKR